MIKLSTNSIENGLMPAEKIAIIEVENGETEEVSVSESDISPDNKLMASEIGRKGDRVLVELPRESASGRWRVWVKAASVGT